MPIGEDSVSSVCLICIMLQHLQLDAIKDLRAEKLHGSAHGRITRPHQFIKNSLHSKLNALLKAIFMLVAPLWPFCFYGTEIRRCHHGQSEQWRTLNYIPLWYQEKIMYRFIEKFGHFAWYAIFSFNYEYPELHSREWQYWVRKGSLFMFPFFVCIYGPWARTMSLCIWLWWQCFGHKLAMTCRYSRFDKLMNKASQHNYHVQVPGSS